MILRTTLFILVFATLSSINAQQIWDITKMGAVANDTTQNQQKIIQSAVDKCNLSGGGTVYFPPGDYMTGMIVLKSNVTLHFEAGATLYASLNPVDYENEFIVYKAFSSGKAANEATPVLIYANKAENISIKGMGKIHGRARRTYDPLEKIDGFIKAETELARAAGVEMKMYYKVRPYTCMVFLESCKNVKIQDVTLEESTDWTLHFKWCEQVVVDGAKIYSDLVKGVNADGIDIDGCKDVLVSNCIIKTGDDAIVLKSTATDGRFESCERVAVTNCTLVSTSTALKLGTESFGDFRHILFSNCVITDTNRGLGIIVRDGGTVSDVAFTNITLQTNRKHFNWWGNGDPIWIVIKKRSENSKIGAIENVRFENIYSVGQGTTKIEGFDALHSLKNIQFKNVQLVVETEQLPDKRSANILEAHDVDGLTISGSSFIWAKGKTQKNWQSSIVLKEVRTLRLDEVTISSFEKQNAPAIQLTNVSEALITGVESQNALDQFIQIKGKASKHIVVTTFDLMKRSKKPLVQAKEVDANEISFSQ